MELINNVAGALVTVATVGLLVWLWRYKPSARFRRRRD